MKALKYLLIAFLGFLLLCGSSPLLVDQLTKMGILKDEIYYRDLYKKTYLPQFLEQYPTCNLKDPLNADVKLHVIGDSFIEQLIDQNGKNFSNWDFTHVLFKRKLVLKPNKKNIMLIAMVERTARNRFKLSLDNYHPRHETQQKNIKKPILFFKDQLFEDVFLSCFPISKIKELKARFNLWAFGQYASSTKIINNGADVVYIDDITEEQYAMYQFGNEEQAAISRNLENIEASYKKLGFDKVIFCVLPNKNTIYGTSEESYSGLIEKLEAMNVDFLKIHDAFKNKRYYFKDDTHWNCAGRAKFLELLAAKLNEK